MYAGKLMQWNQKQMLPTVKWVQHFRVLYQCLRLIKTWRWGVSLWNGCDLSQLVAQDHTETHSKERRTESARERDRKIGWIENGVRTEQKTRWALRNCCCQWHEKRKREGEWETGREEGREGERWGYAARQRERSPSSYALLLRQEEGRERAREAVWVRVGGEVGQVWERRHVASFWLSSDEMLERKKNTNQAFLLHKASLFSLIFFIYFNIAGQWPRYCHFLFMSCTVALAKPEGLERGIWKLICFMNFLPPVNTYCGSLLRTHQFISN